AESQSGQWTLSGQRRERTVSKHLASSMRAWMLTIAVGPRRRVACSRNPLESAARPIMGDRRRPQHRSPKRRMSVEQNPARGFLMWIEAVGEKGLQAGCRSEEGGGLRVAEHQVEVLDGDPGRALDQVVEAGQD